MTDILVLCACKQFNRFPPSLPLSLHSLYIPTAVPQESNDTILHHAPKLNDINHCCCKQRYEYIQGSGNLAVIITFCSHLSPG